MDFINYSVCEKNLDFSPIKTWPKIWPAFAWNGLLISGFEKSRKTLHFTNKDVSFLNLFHTCYPSLKLSEIGRIILKWRDISKLNFLWTTFFTLYKNTSSNVDLTVALLKKLMASPLSFQHWVDEKALHLAELRSLNSLEDVQPFFFFLHWIAEKNLSRSVGVKTLELGVELFLTSVLEESWLELENVGASIEKMEKARRPISFSHERNKRKIIHQMPWPAGVSADFLRKGDKAGIEVRIWSQSRPDWDKKIKTVNQMIYFDKE